MLVIVVPAETTVCSKFALRALKYKLYNYGRLQDTEVFLLCILCKIVG